jgi:hypothetical protein
MKTILALSVGAVFVAGANGPAVAITCQNAQTGEIYASPQGSCWLGERQIWRGPSDDQQVSGNSGPPDNDDGLHAAPHPSISAHPTMPTVMAAQSARHSLARKAAAVATDGEGLEATERLISDGLKTYSAGPWSGGQYKDISFDKCTMHVKAVIRHDRRTEDYVIYDVPLDDIDSVTPADDNLVVDSTYSVETRLAHRISAGKKKGEWSYLYEREKFVSFLVKDAEASQRLARAMNRAVAFCKATG